MKMKKVSVIAVVAALAVFCSAMYGWSQAVGGQAGPPAQVDVKAFRQFQKETLPLRDELMAKRLELRNEYAQANPNYDRIAALQKEMIDLRTKIQATAQKNGLPAWGAGFGRGGCQGAGAGWSGGPGAGWGGGPGAGWGRGPGGGRGYGNANCPMWK